MRELRAIQETLFLPTQVDGSTGILKQKEVFLTGLGKKAERQTRASVIYHCCRIYLLVAQNNHHSFMVMVSVGEECRKDIAGMACVCGPGGKI